MHNVVFKQKKPVFEQIYVVFVQPQFPFSKNRGVEILHENIR